MPAWQYEVDEQPKRKHHWDKPRAGFEFVGNDDVPIGKCPSTMSLEEAGRLLNDGVPFFPDGWKESFPKRIYAVHDGVVYRATPTNPGKSYHGFPATSRELNRLPSSMRNAILQKAQVLGCAEGVRRWMSQSP